jgi:hypothetical protein
MSNSGPSAIGRLTTAVIILYSLFVVASIIPSLYFISSVPIAVYYLLVPGYCITRLMEEQYGILQRLLFSVAVGTTVILTLSAFRQTLPTVLALPFNVVIPVFALLLTLYSYYHPKPRTS